MAKAGLFWLLLVALATYAAGDGMRMMAPGPATSMMPKAELLFIVSANTANFTSPTRLVLGGLSYTAQFTASNKAGIYPIGVFMNGTDGAPLTSMNGEWLNNPQGVLYGSASSGNMTAVLLDLSNPMYDSETNTATFDVATIKASKLRDGAVSNAANDAAKSVGPMVMSTVNATTEFRAAALFIDSTRLALGRSAETKWFGWGGGWGGGGWGGGGWGGGYYRPYYYQPYYYQQPYYYGGCGWGCGK